MYIRSSFSVEKTLLGAVRLAIMRGKSYYSYLCRAYALAHFKKEERYADYLSLYDELLSR